MMTKSVEIPLGVRTLLESIQSDVPKQRANLAFGAVQRLFDDSLLRISESEIFVSTGDIEAMWLRDSTAQVKPLLITSRDNDSYEVFASISRMQARLFLIDPYANAFNAQANGNYWKKDFENQSPWVFERKFEVDSLAALIDLAISLYDCSGRSDHLDEQFVKAITVLLEVVDRESNHLHQSYRFLRDGERAIDYLSHDGYGAPFQNTGMVWSGFRPSDDACKYPFHVPSNAYLATSLIRLSNIDLQAFPHTQLKAKAKSFAQSINTGIVKFGVVNDRFAYEVDGLGNYLLEDDANLPNLLTLPYIGWCEHDDPRYLKTRAEILSLNSPTYFQGRVASGIGSIHTPDQHVWPISIAMQAITSGTESEILAALDLLESTTAGTFQMHESFHVDDPMIFTRAWFSWADMTYLQLVLCSINSH